MAATKSDPQTDSLTRCCDAHLAATLDFLQRMVAINSFTENIAGIDELTGVTCAQFGELGFEATRAPAANPRYGQHLALKRSVSPSGPTIALLSHLDTVYTVEEEQRNNFVWRAENPSWGGRVPQSKRATRIYGPGTNDIKGGTALIYLLLHALRTTTPAAFDSTNWVILLNSCEEVVSEDFGLFCRAQLPADPLACLIFEGDGGSDDFSLVSARKGRATFRVTVTGRSAHAGGDHRRGANAITQLARVAMDLEQMTDYPAGLTVNVATIQGGTVTNRVPHLASLELEMRAFDPAVYASARSRILSWNREGEVGSVGDDPFHCRVVVEVTHETVPWPRNAGTDRLVALWQETGRDLGLSVRSEERGGLSDGNVLWNHFPTIDGLGPRGENSHCSEMNLAEGKEQEWVDVPSIVPKTVLNATAILRLLAR